jgi:outer membrane biosynthesis protein TonB
MTFFLNKTNANSDTKEWGQFKKLDDAKASPVQKSPRSLFSLIIIVSLLAGSVGGGGVWLALYFINKKETPQTHTPPKITPGKTPEKKSQSEKIQVLEKQPITRSADEKKTKKKKVKQTSEDVSETANLPPVEKAKTKKEKPEETDYKRRKTYNTTNDHLDSVFGGP